jgi:malate synthase
MDTPDGLEVTGPMHERFEEILSPTALELIARLHRELNGRRQELLAARRARDEELAAGGTLDFLEETRAVREDDSWRVAEPAPGLVDRRVEITGPTDRKMAINALNSGAKVWLADHEDANTPLWENVVGGQLNLRDALRGQLDFTSPEGKAYALKDGELATIVMRPRGWHLPEKHVRVDGEPTSGSLVDFALYMAASAQLQIDRGLGPYFYLPKMESHLEARLWNDIFVTAQAELGLPRGTIKATVLIETILAAFEMDEILYELREHSAGLNAGRWDYIFSCIKKFKNDRDFCLADRAKVTMRAPFMRAYALLLLKTCHHRNAPAIGGMSALIPIKNDPEKNAIAMEGIIKDKRRDAMDGYDGGWVAHPGLVEAAMKEFVDVLGERPNQIERKKPYVYISAEHLLEFAPERPITEAGLRMNINVGIYYLGSWLAGNGCVPIYNLMEDAATAEISRSQVWQWIRSPKGVLEDGRKITAPMVRQMVAEELAGIKEAGYQGNTIDRAAQIFEQMSTQEEFAEFLTLGLYEEL